MSLDQYPIFIICRDRVSDLALLVSWLEKVGQEKIYFIDNASTYEPLLDYYKNTPHNVIHMGWNSGHTGIWNSGTLGEILGPDQHFVVTDPDIVPTEECPDNALDYFRELLNENSGITKAGFGLRIDDLPNHYKFKDEVIAYERGFWGSGRDYPQINYAPIDTTFALYKPGASQDISYCIRTAHPYVARHAPWYMDSNNLSEEELYYREHANQSITSWNSDSLPHWWRPL